MSYSSIGVKRKTEAFKTVLGNLETKRSHATAFQQIKELCEACRPSSPLLCVELCEIWHLKQEFPELVQAPTERPDLSALFNIIKNPRRLLILGCLIEKPCSLNELQIKLKTQGYYHSLSTLHTHYVQPVLDGVFAREEENRYTITRLGKSLYRIFIQSDLAELPIHSKGYEEHILRTLLSESKSWDELATIIPKNILTRSLKRLQTHEFITPFNHSGRIFYRATKQRATRKMTPTETRIFKVLKKSALSAQDISHKVGISVRRVYKYLRRLRYKRHVFKEAKHPSYKLTKKGQRLAQSLIIVDDLISRYAGG